MFTPALKEARISKRKIFYPVGPNLAEYLARYGRSVEMPNIYDDLRCFMDSYPLFDKTGKNTLWETVVYENLTMKQLHRQLTTLYSMLKTGETKALDHLYISRVDFCDFGNSKPFRIRVVNQFNDNYDYFYVKVTDASRVHGLELEHILSPNRISYLVNSGTLIEDHIVGIPGDAFMESHMDRPDINTVRLAKEFIKFNERCFLRLLGDMRSYNYVVDLTQDFDGVQFRVRAIDFDQQSYEGRKEIYFPQLLRENGVVVKLCTDLINYQTTKQYQREERSLIARRIKTSTVRLGQLFACMKEEACSPQDKTDQLIEELAEYHHTSYFNQCQTMGDVVEAHISFMLEAKD